MTGRFIAVSNLKRQKKRDRDSPALRDWPNSALARVAGGVQVEAPDRGARPLFE